MALGEDLGELADPLVGGRAARAALQERVAGVALVVGEAVGVAGEPPGHVSDRRRRGRSGRWRLLRYAAVAGSGARS